MKLKELEKLNSIESFRQENVRVSKKKLLSF